MIAAEATVLILLAAGRSSRFGDTNKLEAEFLGRPVGLHAVTALEGVPFQARYAIRDDCSLHFAAHGFVEIANPHADRGMAESIRLGVAAARDAGAAAVLVALADMPRVTATHVFRLLDAADSGDAVVASSDGEQPRPPALFGRGRFEALLALEGDAGARAMIRGARHVVTSPAELIDIDTPEELAALRYSHRSS